MQKLFISVLIITGLLVSCGDKVDNTQSKKTVDNSIYDETGALKTDIRQINSGDFSYEKLLANIGLDLIIPTTKQFEQDTAALKEETNKYCNNIQNSSDLNAEQVEFLRSGIQSAWKKAMKTYHRLELFNFGPVQEDSSTFSKAVYTYHYSSKCLIDRRVNLMATRNRLPNLGQTDNYQERGLDTLEPLFFDDVNASRCKRVGRRLQTWLEKDLVERQKDVCRYSQHLIEDIVIEAKELADAWALDKGNYLVEILRNEKLGTHIQAINKISKSLFQLDTLKAKKLAYPAGFETKIDQQVVQCSSDSCPEKAEHLYAKLSIESLIENMQAFKDLFEGKSGFGFDDFLKQEGYEKLSEDFSRSINTSLVNLKKALGSTTIQELSRNIDRAECEASTTTDRKVEVCALLADIKVVTDLLKNEYLLALKDLSAPRETQGDLD